MSATARLEAAFGITRYVPANSRFIPEKSNEGRYVGVTSSGFTSFTFSREEVEASHLPIEKK